MDFEGILHEVGDFGKYQKSLLLKFMVPTTFASAFYVLNVIFMVATPDHWCFVPELSAFNLTESEIKNFAVPKLPDGSYSKCTMYAYNYTAVAAAYKATGKMPEFKHVGKIIPRKPTRKCTNGWVYQKDLYEETVVSQWDLVCDKNYLPSLVLTLATAGSVLGTFIFSSMADRQGRKSAFLANIAVAVVSGVLSIFSPTFAVFAILRALTGSTVPANFQLPYIITVEQVGSKQRAVLVCISWLLWTSGACCLALVAYISRHWTTLGLVTTLPVAAFLAYKSESQALWNFWSRLYFTLIFFLGAAVDKSAIGKLTPDEHTPRTLNEEWNQKRLYLKQSPRYLMTRGRCEEASDIIKQIAEINGRTAPSELLQKLKKISEDVKTSDVQTASDSCFDIFRYPQLRKKLFVVTLNWTAIAVAYFGLTLNVTNLGKNDFLNFFLLSAVELPAFPLALIIMEKVGRRWSNTVFVLLTGVACLVPSFLTKDMGTSAIIASMLGKFGSAAAFMVVYQQAAELYPTPVRAIGMGIGSVVSSLAVICMPYVCYLGIYNKAIPFLIIGTLCVSAGLIAPLVPETLNKRLPQTIQDSEEFGTGKGCLPCCSNDDIKDDEHETVDPTSV